MAVITQENISDTDLDQLLAELDELIAQATSSEEEGDEALALRSIAW